MTWGTNELEDNCSVRVSHGLRFCGTLCFWCWLKSWFR